MASIESEQRRISPQSELGKLDKLELEGRLLLEGTWDGFSQRLAEDKDKPWVPAIEAAAYTGLSYGLSALAKSSGELGAAGKAIYAGLYLSGACDAYGILAPTGRTMLDTWNNPHHFEMNKAAIAKTLGTTAFDYSIMLGTNAGIRKISRLPMAESLKLFGTPLSELSSTAVANTALKSTLLSLGKAELVDLGMNRFHLHESIITQHNATGLKGERQFDFTQISSANDANGIDETGSLKAGEKLSAGDHTIQFANGRQFLVHVPDTSGQDTKPLKVMFLVPGASNTTQDSKNYVAEAYMNNQSDAGSDKFIVVTPLTERHFLSDDSKLAASAWNLPGAMLKDEDVKKHADQVGYDDRDYFAGVINLVPQIANADIDKSHWGFTAGSQGAAALMRLAGEDRFKNIFQNLYFAGGTVEQGNATHPVAPYTFAEGNGKHVTLIRTDGDNLVLPLPENQKPHPLYSFAMSAVVPYLYGMEAFDNWNQDPRQLTDIAVQHLKQQGSTVDTLYLPTDPNQKLKTYGDFSKQAESGPNIANLAETLHHDQDRLLTIHLKNDPDGLKQDVKVVYLPTAKHVIPGPVEGTTSITKKYQGFFSAKAIAEDFRRITSAENK